MKLPFVVKDEMKLTVYALAFIPVLVLSYIDYLTPEDYSLYIFLAIPVGILTWFFGRKSGIISSIAVTLIHFSSHILEGGLRKMIFFHIWNAAAEILALITIVLILFELKKSLVRETTLARVDHLTGVFNYRAFSELGEYEMNKAARTAQPISVAYIDIDSFKTLNDTRGHNAGNDMLKLLVTLIKSNVRSFDTLARLGGDEFGLLLPAADQNTAGAILRRINESINSNAEVKNAGITLSIGSVTCERPACSFAAMLEDADKLKNIDNISVNCV
jgi:diguanylate cyclase (GGDEF)-like protein